MKRICRACLVAKSIGEFRLDKRTGHRYRVCIQCNNAKDKRKANVKSGEAGLLWMAAETIAMYWPEAMPKDVREWYDKAKARRLADRIAASEAGVADAAVGQVITTENELQEGCC